MLGGFSRWRGAGGVAWRVSARGRTDSVHDIARGIWPIAVTAPVVRLSHPFLHGLVVIFRLRREGREGERGGERERERERERETGRRKGAGGMGEGEPHVVRV